MKDLKLWGGFVNGKLFKQKVHEFPSPEPMFEQWCPAIFYSRKEAQKRFEDVRRVTVTVNDSQREE